ncbi:MAG: NADH-quinone oxidoreductase subunit C [Pseudomonadota bacterium]|nr:NADH-quinone oxidoreductase subunit C [Pseudomonadota bacterium]
MKNIERLQALQSRIAEIAGEAVQASHIEFGELTVDLVNDSLHDVCRKLISGENFAFDTLIDVCGVDYLQYRQEAGETWGRPRFAVVYHLLSTSRNQRLRLRVFVEESSPMVDSVIDIWKSADWFEREAFDLFGILFKGHPDLRRILTDYGFVGHPFRKDFPVSGHVEMRYDEDKGRVVYQPVSIEPRVLVPRVIREEGYGA